MLVGESSFGANPTCLRHGTGVESQGVDAPTALAGVLTLSQMFLILAENQ